ncbi:MAG: hypothetical protein KUG79_13335 [Pseudomonadales bacterium]|nr:hypothetical protein [Pseudomonadales bacterium]
MGTNQKIIQLLMLIVASSISIAVMAEQGPQGFPIFRMEIFDEALDDNELFDEEIPEIDMPRVSQRVYSSDEKARLPVVNIIIEGVKSYPQFGITQERLQAVIDRRFRIEQSIQLDDNGFTGRDLDDIGSFLREVIDRGGEDEEDLDVLLSMVRRQEFKRGWITIEQLDKIALAVTEYYRERGFILATAYIPEQEVTDGVIRLGVLEGRLGKVTVSNNEVYSPDIVSAAFVDEIGKPVTDAQVESALRRVNNLPGLRVRGSFSPGQNIGETNLNLGVLEEKSWRSNVILDNHGSETTGENRVFATAEWLNLRNKGNRLLVGVLRSEGPDSSLYGLAEYEMPVTKNGQGKMKFNISFNEFSVGATANIPEIIGETANYSVGGSYQLSLSRTRSLSVQTSFSYKDVLLDADRTATLSSDQQLGVFSASTEYTRLWDDQLLLFSGRLGIDQGNIIKGNRDGQSTDFTKTLLNFSLLKRTSVYNWVTKNESSLGLVFKANAQYAEKRLASVEQFSLGGPAAVRAFGVSDVSVDSGIYLGVEVLFSLPVDPVTRFKLPLDTLKPYFFYDYAYGVGRSSATSEENNDSVIKGYGLGMRMSWPNRGSADLIFAKPRSASFDDGTIDARGESRIYFNFLYQLRNQ